MSTDIEYHVVSRDEFATFAAVAARTDATFHGVGVDGPWHTTHADVQIRRLGEILQAGRDSVPCSLQVSEGTAVYTLHFTVRDSREFRVLLGAAEVAGFVFQPWRGVPFYCPALASDLPASRASFYSDPSFEADRAADVEMCLLHRLFISTGILDGYITPYAGELRYGRLGGRLAVSLRGWVVITH